MREVLGDHCSDASGETNSQGVTGGVYKALVHIHRGMLIVAILGSCFVILRIAWVMLLKNVGLNELLRESVSLNVLVSSAAMLLGLSVLAKCLVLT